MIILFDYYFKTDDNMTPNKQFNTYKEGLDLGFLREYCMEHGERRTFERGETLEEAGKPAQWVAYVERECFKYMAHRSALMTFGLSKNDEEDKNGTVQSFV